MKVFKLACECGREKELFGITKEDHESHLLTLEYFRAIDEYELLGSESGRSPADFFVGLKCIVQLYCSTLCTIFLHTNDMDMCIC